MSAERGGCHRRRTPTRGGLFPGLAALVFGAAVSITAVLLRWTGVPPAVQLTAAPDVATWGATAVTGRAQQLPGWGYAGVAERTVLTRARSVSRDRSRVSEKDRFDESAHPAAWRVLIAAGAYHLTAGFGECSALWARCHTGLDFAAPSGTPILAVAAGVIASTGWAGAFGYRTVETLPDGTELWYCHQSSTEVAPGDRVSRGQAVGRVGASGNATGPHLHIEVRPDGGDPVDPYAALAAHGATP